jgi:hypothetical protein
LITRLTAILFCGVPGVQPTFQCSNIVIAPQLHRHHSKRFLLSTRRNHHIPHQLWVHLDRVGNPSGPEDQLVDGQTIETVDQFSQGKIERFGLIELEILLRTINVDQQGRALVEGFRLNVHLG